MKARIIDNKHNLLLCGFLTMILIVCFGLYNTVDQILKHTTIDHISAENFACSDANFQTEDVLILSNDFIKEKGKYVYRISFVNNNDKYDYVINGKDGSVIHKSQSISDVVYLKEKNNTDKSINIDIEKAKNIASSYYEIKNKDNLIYTKAKLDDEKDLVYSINMNDNEKEYYAEISATNGNVLSFQVKEKQTKINNANLSKSVNTNSNENNLSSQISNTSNNETNHTTIVKETQVNQSPTATPIPTSVTTPEQNQSQTNFDDKVDDIDDDDDDDDYDIDEDDDDDDD